MLALQCTLASYKMREGRRCADELLGKKSSMCEVTVATIGKFRAPNVGGADRAERWLWSSVSRAKAKVRGQQGGMG